MPFFLCSFGKDLQDHSHINHCASVTLLPQLPLSCYVSLAFVAQHLLFSLFVSPFPSIANFQSPVEFLCSLP